MTAKAPSTARLAITQHLPVSASEEGLQLLPAQRAEHKALRRQLTQETADSLFSLFGSWA